MLFGLALDAAFSLIGVRRRDTGITARFDLWGNALSKCGRVTPTLFLIILLSVQPNFWCCRHHYSVRLMSFVRGARRVPAHPQL